MADQPALLPFADIFSKLKELYPEEAQQLTDWFLLARIQGIRTFVRDEDTGEVTVTYNDDESETFMLEDGRPGPAGPNSLLLPYDDRRQASIAGGAAGQWLVVDADGNAIDTHPIPWDAVAQFILSARDNEGEDFARVFDAGRLQEAGQPVGFQHTDANGNVVTIYYRTTGVVVHTEADNSYTFPVERVIALDSGNADTVRPQVAVDYDLEFFLPLNAFVSSVQTALGMNVVADLASQTAQWVSFDEGVNFAPLALMQELTVNFLRLGEVIATLTMRGTRNGLTVTVIQQAHAGEPLTVAIANNAASRVTVTATHDASNAKANMIFEALILGELVIEGDPPAAPVATLTRGAGSTMTLAYVLGAAGDSPITLVELRIDPVRNINLHVSERLQQYVDVDPATGAHTFTGIPQNTNIRATVRAGSLIGFGAESAQQELESGNYAAIPTPLGPAIWMFLDTASAVPANRRWRVVSICEPVTWADDPRFEAVSYGAQSRKTGGISTNRSPVVPIDTRVTDFVIPLETEYRWRASGRVPAGLSSPSASGYTGWVDFDYSNLPTSNGALACDVPADITGQVGTAINVVMPQGAGALGLVHDLVPRFAWMNFDPATRILSGVPNFPISATFYYTVTEGTAAQIFRELNITIAAAPGAPDYLRQSGNRGFSYFRLAWDGPDGDIGNALPFNGYSPINDYDIRFRRKGSTRWRNWSHIGTDTEALLTGLSPNTTYQVQVMAENAVGAGPWSHVFEFTTADVS